jgi:hypothetical protein
VGYEVDSAGHFKVGSHPVVVATELSSNKTTGQNPDPPSLREPRLCLFLPILHISLARHLGFQLHRHLTSLVILPKVHQAITQESRIIMSASSLSDLPTELICNIFEAAADFSVVAALAKTVRIFYYTWQEHAGSIYEAVAPRAISNLAVAERLANEQEAAEARKQPHNGRNKSITRVKRLLSNMRCVSAASAEWVGFCEIHKWRQEQTPMTSSEHSRFQHAFYCV